jgi:hypothetical protein
MKPNTFLLISAVIMIASFFLVHYVTYEYLEGTRYIFREAALLNITILIEFGLAMVLGAKFIKY